MLPLVMKENIKEKPGMLEQKDLQMVTEIVEHAVKPIKDDIKAKLEETA